uniref:Reverse transcriptase domain-containing protein n=1 Tax=Tanacetum cinerariifolium TaxID=118510 RepID=A0A699HDS3_TANCI|nr:reverse transcriptase domain-containing protein [Tanacetum cinerariifolium]
MQMVDDNVRNQGLSVVSEITNQHRNGNVETTPAESNGNSINDAYEETQRVKVNCTSEDTLQQASTSRTQSENALVYDSDGSTEEKEYAILWNNWYTKCEECNYDKISYDKACNDMQQNIKRLQAQLGDLKGKTSDTQCASNILDLVSRKLKDENVSLEFQCMRTRSSSNLPVESPPNPSTSNPKCRNRRRSKQPFILEESLVDTMVDQRTMAELLRAPTEGYAKAIVVLPILAEQFELKHSLINMMTLDQFFGLEKDNPHDHIRWGSPSVAQKRTLALYSHLRGSCFQIH